MARGGNLLLDIGPKADGTIPLVMQDRLLGIGEWLKTNGEAIYGSQPWHDAPADAPEGVYFTTVGPDLYVLLTRPCGSVNLPSVRKPAQAMALGSGLKAAISGGKLRIPQKTMEQAAAMPQVIKLTGALR